MKMHPFKTSRRSDHRTGRMVLVLTAALVAAIAVMLRGPVAQAAFQGTDYYVATTGNDGNACTSAAAPCRTIQAAIDRAPAGSTVHVAAGNYNENITMKSGVDVLGDSASTTVIVGAASVNGIVNFPSVTDATLAGVRITVSYPVAGTDRGVNFTGATDRTAVLRNSIIHSVQYGIFVWAPATPTIENNTIVGDPDEQGIYIGNTPTTPLIRNNIITGFYFAGIHVVGGDVAPRPVIEYNDLWNNATNYHTYPDQTGINGNIAADPLFVNAAALDLHLSNSPTFSPGIDSGSPASDYTKEPAPNGSRINMGAYGNTAEAATSTYTCYPYLPWPEVRLTRADFASGGVEYRLAVENWGAYPDELFQPAPNLPPCGANPNAARSWVNIFDGGDDSYIYGYCALDEAAGLQNLWFFVSDTEPTPLSVYLTILDRGCGLTYYSNQVEMPTAPLTCYTLATNPEPAAGGSILRSLEPNCGGTGYLENSVVELTAVNNPGYTFIGWSGNAGGTANPMAVTMNANKSVTAHFRPPCYTLGVTHSGAGSDPTAAPTKSALCPSTGQFVAGEAISLSASPATGWRVAGWSGTENDGSTATSNTLTMPAANHTASVTYAQQCYTLGVTHSGSGGDPVAAPGKSAACGNPSRYVMGEVISLSASPATGWRVAGWSGTAADGSTAGTNSVTMPAAGHTVGVTYAPRCYDLGLFHTGEGSDPTAAPAKSAACSQTGRYVVGEVISLEAEPATDWQVEGWDGADDDSSTATTNTLIMPAANHQVTVRYMGTPSPRIQGDAYEVDDSCAQAQTIPVDGGLQDHTFHVAGDNDWVRFQAQAGVRYRLEVQAQVGSPADVNLMLYAGCDAAPTERWEKTFTPGVRLDFQAPSDGQIYLRLTNVDPTVAGPHVAYQASVRQLQETTGGKGALIIVAGRYKTPDPLQSNIHYVTDFVYDLYRSSGYSDDEIRYLALDPTRPGYHGPSTLANLEEAITTWAVDRVDDHRPLTLFLMDHGDDDTLFVDEINRQRLTPAQLDAWLAQLEAAVPDLDVTVIVEACYSGSFIHGAQSISTPQRTIITSTSAGAVAFASAKGAQFSDRFLSGLSEGYGLCMSFRNAADAVQKLHALQEPWIDVNGNRVPNEAADCEVAGTRRSGTEDAPADSFAPYIAQAQSPAEIVDGQGVIQAQVRDNGGVARVWAVIYGPDYTAGGDGLELVMEDLPTVELARQEGDLFSATYSGFTELGSYRVAIYAEDEGGLTAPPFILDLANGRRLFLSTIFR